MRGRASRVVAAIVAVGALTLTACTTPATSTGAAPAAEGVVVAVVDGDTIDVAIDGGDVERVRLLGIDAPEVGRDGAASECFAEESRDILNESVYDQRVTLTADPTQDDVDRYDRLLRYVDVGDVDAAQRSCRPAAPPSTPTTRTTTAARSTSTPRPTRRAQLAACGRPPAMVPEPGRPHRLQAHAR